MQRPAMTTVTVELPPSLEQFVESQLAERGIGVTEYIVDLVREAKAREEEDEERLEELLLEGLNSPRHVFDEAFRAKLDAKVEAILGFPPSESS